MEINNPEVVAEVNAAHERYETALTSNDVAVLDELFWNSEHTFRMGIGELLYGHEQIAAFRAARSPKGVERNVGKTVLTTFGRDFAVVNREFFRDGVDGIGRQTQSWARLPEGWRIVAAHVSVIPEPD